MNPQDLAASPAPEALLHALVLAAAGLVLYLFRPKERLQAKVLVVAIGASVLLRLAGVALARAEMPALGRTAAFLSLLLQGIAVVHLVAILLYAVVLRALRMEPPLIVREVSIAFAYVGLALYLFSVHRVDVSGIVATSAVITAVVGFSLQDTLANVMGGMAVQIDRSIQPGDWVRIGEQTGRVSEIGWRHTLLLARNGDRIAIPNSLLSRTPILLQGSHHGGAVQQMRWVHFSVSFDVSSERVVETVTEALGRRPIPNVAADPPAHVVLHDIHASVAGYVARYWLTDLALDEVTDSLVRQRVHAALARAGVHLAVPVSSVRLAREAAPGAEEARAAEAEARQEAIRNVPFLRGLNDVERARLAEALRPAVFARGEAIVVQGADDHHLFVLTAGEAEVEVTVEGAPARSVARLSAPDVFGEMALLTGERRRASVVAATEARCYRLDKETFQEILAARPEIAEEISDTLAKRDVELAAVREGLSEEAMRRRLAAERGSLLGRMRSFFGMG